MTESFMRVQDQGIERVGFMVATHLLTITGTTHLRMGSNFRHLQDQNLPAMEVTFHLSGAAKQERAFPLSLKGKLRWPI
ncbi:hypothetical protein EOPP23_20985 [Endozoicomonas sp. OPT23]|nr:hypothetical protein [Endozoicomonas sp. OPT23]